MNGPHSAKIFNQLEGHLYMA